jgi:hypothetical protein
VDGIQPVPAGDGRDQFPVLPFNRSQTYTLITLEEDSHLEPLERHSVRPLFPKRRARREDVGGARPIEAQGGHG